MIVAISGHRPPKIGGFNNHKVHTEVCMQLIYALEMLGATKIISGLALGVDTIAIEAAENLCIPYIAAIPFVGQELRWPKESQELYRQMVENADDPFVVCEGGYAPWKLQKRNEWMVDHCDAVLAVWDGSTGGTYNCIRYADKQGKQIYHIPVRHVNDEVIIEHYRPIAQRRTTDIIS